MKYLIDKQTKQKKSIIKQENISNIQQYQQNFYKNKSTQQNNKKKMTNDK